MTNWEAYIREAKSLLRPGGWFEVQETTKVVYQHGEDISDTWRWSNLASSGARDLFLEPLCGDYAERWMGNAGFVDVERMEYVLPFGTWDVAVCGFLFSFKLHQLFFSVFDVPELGEFLFPYCRILSFILLDWEISWFLVFEICLFSYINHISSVLLHLIISSKIQCQTNTILISGTSRIKTHRRAHGALPGPSISVHATTIPSILTHERGRGRRSWGPMPGSS